MNPRKLATVARPGVIVSTRIDTTGLHDQAQTVTFTTIPGERPSFTTTVAYTTPARAEHQHDEAVRNAS